MSLARLVPRLGAALWRVLWIALLCASASAQTLDDVDTGVQQGVPFARIRFNASVRFVQITPVGAADLYTVQFEIVSADDNVMRQANDEFRRIPAGGGLPEMAISYAGDPSNRAKQLVIHLGRAQLLQARQGPNSRSIEILAPPAAAPAAAASAPTPTAASPATPMVAAFAIVLQSSPVSTPLPPKLVPKGFEKLELVVEQADENGVPSTRMVLRSFATRADADAALALARPRFPDAHVIAINIPATAAAPTDEAAQRAQASQPGVEAQAGALMTQARDALAAKQPDAAIAALNDLLKLPPNAQSAAAQELIGNAWEMAQNTGRARVEYELYLKLYPDAPDAARVRERLAALGPAPAAPGAVTTVAAAKPKLWSGSIAQYYYGGRAKTQSLVNIATGIDQATLSNTTESSIVTSVDLAARYVGESSETRAVVRGSGSTNLLSTSHSSSSISSVYVENRRTAGALQGLAIRAGRQSPISGGLLGLFDGVSLTYPLRPGIKLDVMGGVPASPLVSAPSEELFAAVIEADTFLERYGGNFYLLNQSTQGITERRALGTELRYSGDRWSLDGILDYDAIFNAINALSLHASLQAAAQTTLTVLVDERRAPSLQLSNALISSGADSLKTMLLTNTLDQVRADALATSAIAKQLLVSLARPLNPRWQFSTDLRYSEVGALPAVGDFTATPATGGQYGWSAQFTGTNLYSKRDINNFDVSLLVTPLFKGAELSYNNLTGLRKNNELTLEPSIRLYAQRDSLANKLLRFDPGLRMTYKADSRSSLLGELLYEISRSTGPTNSDHSDSVFFYVGYRYELF